MHLQTKRLHTPVTLQIPKPSAELNACEAVHANPEKLVNKIILICIPDILCSSPLLVIFLIWVLGKMEENDGEMKNEKGFQWKKRKGKEKIEDEEEKGCDPLLKFGSDVMLIILSFLDARSVALSLLVSRGWYGVASSDRLWSNLVSPLSLSLPPAEFLLFHGFYI